MSQIKEARRITVAEMAPHVHSFSAKENKVNKISDWLINWIEQSLIKAKIKPYDYLPLKSDLAFHIGVSLGTIQNVYRIVEDIGLIESRQKVGSYIKNPDDKNIEKLTSKREVTAETIKKYIAKNGYKNGDVLISTRKLAKELLIPFATVRIAIDYLVTKNVLEKNGKNVVVKSVQYKVNGKEQQTLAEKIAEHINSYIKKNLKPGGKLPSNNTLADMYNVSVKTIHDAIKILSVAGIVKTRRGCYGTIISEQSGNDELYYYEQVEESIKKYIAENCKAGEKLPSIKNFAEVFNVSSKTIKNALDNLASDGYVNFIRGRYGGTFVLEVPTTYKTGYAWLALSAEFEQMN